MKKVTLGPQTLVYPMPAFLVGALVDGKPNFMTAAWGGIANSNPPMLTVALQHHRYTLKGIRENGVLSVNVPSVDLVRETDYCGIVSGSKENKQASCKFEVFFGKLDSAPLIVQCPVNLECRVVHLLDLGSHTLVVGRIEDVHVSEECLADGQPDVDKINPLIYSSGVKKAYRKVGEEIGAAFSIGMEIRRG
jgi:flavin reductase (DIM6/NTAB) family NADH-FMN oxidoreductase RutF